MPQDALHIHRLSRELSSSLVGGHVNRVSQVDKDELTFIIYTGFQTVKLILSTNASFARVCLSEQEKEPAPTPPNFCMLLRKHLLGGEILEVEQKDFERIIEIKILCKSDFSNAERVLICELMGKYSNLILVENGVILGALKTTSLEASSHRVLFPGAKYVYPAPQDKLSPFDESLSARERDFFALDPSRSEERIAQFLFENVSGLALPTAREIAKRRKENFSPFLKHFLLEEHQPHLLYENGEPKDFFAFPVEGGVPVSSLMEAEDIFYSYKETEKIFREKKAKLFSSVKNLQKKQQKNKQDILERLLTAEKSESNKIKGELLTANLYRLEKGMDRFQTENWYAEGETIEIPLDPTLSPSQNAQKYFKLYNKQKRTKEALLPRLAMEEKEEEYVSSILFSIVKAECLQDLTEIETELIEISLLRAPKQKAVGKKKAPVPFRQFEKDGFTILVGRNNLQNDRLLREANGDDVWLHAQKYHSSHVIVVSGGKKVPESVLLYAAKLCARYSAGNGDKIPVDYTLRKYVKKPSKAKAGFVTYVNAKTIFVSPYAP